MGTPKDKTCPVCKNVFIGRYSKQCRSCASKKYSLENGGRVGKPYEKGHKPYCTGKKLKEETKRKISEAHKGMKYTQETIEKRRKKMLGHPVSEETRRKIGIKHKGRRHTEESKTVMSKSQKKRFQLNPIWNKGVKLGEKAPNWRGGISLERSPRRYGDDWENIRLIIYKRDNYTCQECGITMNDAKKPHHVHHIIPFVLSRDNSLNNLITLCPSCHMRIERKITKENKEMFKRGNS